jgi:hypothetical protein
MKKLFPCALLLFACPSSWAQRTVVSGTIADPGGVPYAGASLTVMLSLPTGALGAYLNGAQIAGTVGPVQLDATGSFLVQLADNTQIKCANAIGQIVACVPQTQWNFAITLSPGVLPPFGLGPKTCSASLTITGASQTVTSSFSCPAIVRTSNGIGVFLYKPTDPNTVNTASFGALVDSTFYTTATDGSTFAEMLSFSESQQPFAFQFASQTADKTSATEETLNIIATNSAPTPTGGGVGFNSGARCFAGSTAACASGARVLFGDNTLTANNGQDGAGYVAVPSLNKPAGNMNQEAGFTVYPTSCEFFAGCSGGITETLSNLYGFDVQDLQGRGTALTAGFHVRAQTNPTSTTNNFAIVIDSGGGTSKFDGIATTVNCQLGGAAGTTSPAACTSATAGMIALPASQTSYTVNSTKVTANSEIFVEQMTDNSGLPSAPACNAGATNPIQSARVAGTSFTFTLTSVAAVTCVHFWILN